jgi:hypothetical protein
VLAGFVAGALNAAGGGGTFVALPALVARRHRACRRPRRPRSFPGRLGEQRQDQRRPASNRRRATFRNRPAPARRVQASAARRQRNPRNPSSARRAERPCGHRESPPARYRLRHCHHAPPAPRTRAGDARSGKPRANPNYRPLVRIPRDRTAAVKLGPDRVASVTTGTLKLKPQVTALTLPTAAHA